MALTRLLSPLTSLVIFILGGHLLGGETHRQQGIEQTVTQNQDHQTGQGGQQPCQCHGASSQ